MHQEQELTINSTAFRLFGQNDYVIRPLQINFAAGSVTAGEIINLSSDGNISNSRIKGIAAVIDGVTDLEAVLPGSIPLLTAAQAAGVICNFRDVEQNLVLEQMPLTTLCSALKNGNVMATDFEIDTLASTIIFKDAALIPAGAFSVLFLFYCDK